ncbi:MAG: alpha/beta hydrolase [Thermonemataceae bacterium]
MKLLISTSFTPYLHGIISLKDFLFALTFLMTSCNKDENQEDIPVAQTSIETSENIELFEYNINHVSTIPNFRGESFQLYVREKVKPTILADNDLEGKVVLLIHATITPSISTYDLDYQDYSLMNYLSAQGLDVFAFDLTGYGKSDFPAPMNDPCNLSTNDKTRLGVEDCESTYPYLMTTSFSEIDEINTVVEFIKRTRGVNQVSIFGMSLGGIRALNYTMTHPSKVSKVSVQGVGRYLTLDLTPSEIPASGAPINIVTEQQFLDRLTDDIYTPDQRDVQIHSKVWEVLRAIDVVGQQWGIGCSRHTSTMAYGFLRSDIEQMTKPCLVISGENDKILNPLLPIRFDLGLGLYEDMLASTQKIHLQVNNAGHVMLYDLQAPNMRKALAEWLLTSTVDGQASGEGVLAVDGTYTW